jgi:hypothetical protein
VPLLRRETGGEVPCINLENRGPALGSTAAGRMIQSVMLTPFFILVIIAFLLSLASLIWPKPFLVPISVLFICVALLIGAK